MANTTNSSGGIGFTGALTLLFIGLKLGGVINWSWLWVLSPIWITLLIVIAVLALAVVVGCARGVQRSRTPRFHLDKR